MPRRGRWALAPRESPRRTRVSLSKKTRTTGINTEQAITVIPPVVAARATTTTLVAVTGGHIYMTKLAGERYHTRRNCGHIMGREQKVMQNCLDCAHLDRYD